MYAFIVFQLQGYRYFVKPAVNPSSPDSPIMLGFWLGYQAMLSPTFLILSVFFFSFSELFEEVCATRMHSSRPHCRQS